MSHTIVKVYLHIIFSTRRREPLIARQIEEPLFEHIGGICRNLRCWPVRVGGHSDHVHILSHLNKDVSAMELIEEIKISSTRWLKAKFNSMKNFSWQQGFTCVTVSENDLEILGHYIESQRQHHTELTFEAELRKLLMENAIEVDEHSIWK